MHTPLISVIVPVYNVEQYLEKCLRSILTQTYSALEIIAIDDGSSDNSGRICDQLAMQDKRIKVIHTANKGVAAARNTGISIANGEYISFVDSDDYLEPDFYEYLLSLMIKSNADISYCSYRKVYESNVYDKSNGISRIQILSGREALAKALRIKDGFGLLIWNGLYKYNLVPSFTEGRFIAEDQDFAVKMMMKASVVVKGTAVKYNYLIRPSGSKSVNFEKRMIDTLGALDAIRTILPRTDRYLQRAFSNREMKVYFRLMSAYINAVEGDSEVFRFLRNGIVDSVRHYYGRILGSFLSVFLRLNEDVYRTLFLKKAK